MDILINSIFHDRQKLVHLYSVRAVRLGAVPITGIDRHKAFSDVIYLQNLSNTENSISFE